MPGKVADRIQSPKESFIMRSLLAIFLLSVSLSSFAATGPYDEAADARADVRAALLDAKASGTPVLVVFGANWCGDCRCWTRPSRAARARR